MFDHPALRCRTSLRVLLFATLVPVATLGRVRLAVAETTERVSLSSVGVQGTNHSDTPSSSSDGRFVAFLSEANNLVPADTNTRKDVLVRDRETGTTTRVSVDSAGVAANQDSENPAISGDGRWVAFDSSASNLVASDTNTIRDVFLHDRDTATTIRVSVDGAGAERTRPSSRPAVSEDGRFVAFEANRSSKITDILVWDRESGVSTLVSTDSAGAAGDGTSENPVLSPDGRFVAFESASANLIPGDANSRSDVFVVDRDVDEDETFDEPGEIEVVRVSIGAGGAEGNGHSRDARISDDARQVVFASLATNLVPGDLNGDRDVFVRDRDAEITFRVSVSELGAEGNAESTTPGISADGRIVVFQTAATNLVPDDTNARRDVLLYHRDLDNDAIFDEPGEVRLRRASVDSTGLQGNQDSGTIGRPVVSADGGFAAFDSVATNLVVGDSNGRRDVFVREVDACGNGAVSASESCDDGNLLEGDGCDSNCTPTGCGNGIPTAGEACDDANANAGDACKNDCTLNVCGDGAIRTGIESCDDGNLTSGDGCDANCTPTACGNGIVAGSEGCDDANVLDGDGCDSNCTVTGCGNGVLTDGESCDDANLVSGDGCDANCTPTICGNGIVTGGEDCDDGNDDDGDACKSDCTQNVCGDGFLRDGFEGCDDGNAVSGDGCDANCTATACGNGVVTTGESCDDGNLVSGDGCDATCTPTGCGNGVVTAGEECDGGAANGTDQCCSATCGRVDFDADGTCDATDSADLSGLALKSATVKASSRGDAKPNGSFSWKGTLAIGAPYGSLGGLAAGAQTSGLQVSLFATSGVPQVGDPSIFAFDLAPSDCRFLADASGTSRVLCSRTLPGPEGTRVSFTLKKKKSQVEASAVVTHLAVVPPASGPLRVALRVKDGQQLDYHGSIGACAASTTGRAALRCG
ncbi:MAG: DUF4215 domain-containing protein [Deltaproteobacteria bacterium]|nr:DUF4215 domain-containing protein [Deltaproteobacteria bacterium]